VRAVGRRPYGPSIFCGPGWPPKNSHLCLMVNYWLPKISLYFWLPNKPVKNKVIFNGYFWLLKIIFLMAFGQKLALPLKMGLFLVVDTAHSRPS
jgi:hypothetical protein